jgi:uncharacterized membrane protein YeaQ/YmgE (transglycosylase-associated protein family)
MSIIAWIFMGIISGFVASKVVSGSGKGLVTDLILGVVGAVVGGAAFHLLGQSSVTGFNLWSVFVSALGAAAVLLAFRAVSGRSRA